MSKMDLCPRVVVDVDARCTQQDLQMQDLRDEKVKRLLLLSNSS